MRHLRRGEVQATPPNAAAAEQGAQALRMQGCCAPTWESLLREGASPAPSAGEGAEDISRGGWQKLAKAAVEKRELEMLSADWDNALPAQLPSQSGPDIDVPITMSIGLSFYRGSDCYCPSPHGPGRHKNFDGGSPGWGGG